MKKVLILLVSCALILNLVFCGSSCVNSFDGTTYDSNETEIPTEEVTESLSSSEILEIAKDYIFTKIGSKKYQVADYGGVNTIKISYTGKKITYLPSDVYLDNGTTITLFNTTLNDLKNWGFKLGDQTMAIKDNELSDYHYLRIGKEHINLATLKKDFLDTDDTIRDLCFLFDKNEIGFNYNSITKESTLEDMFDVFGKPTATCSAYYSEEEEKCTISFSYSDHSGIYVSFDFDFNPYTKATKFSGFFISR